jgi:hypothetical protein
MDETFEEMPAEDQSALDALGERLLRERPVPAAAFRGNLRRRLIGRSRDLIRRPSHLWLRAGASGMAGSVMLLVAALSIPA